MQPPPLSSRSSLFASTRRDSSSSHPSPSVYGSFVSAAGVDYAVLFSSTAALSTSSASSSPISLSAVDDSLDEDGGAAALYSQWAADAAGGAAGTGGGAAHFSSTAAQHPQRAAALVGPSCGGGGLDVSDSPFESTFVSSSTGSTGRGGTGRTGRTERSGTSPGNEQPAMTTAPKLSRKRAGFALSVDERLQRRRAQHRAVDTCRRQKENEAIARLHTLVQQQTGAPTGQVDSGVGVGLRVATEVDEASGVTGHMRDMRHMAAAVDVEDEDDSELGKQQRAGRLTVLESSIALIEQLTAACKRMDAACNAKDATVSRVSNQLHNVAAVIAQQATSLALLGPVDQTRTAGLPAAERAQRRQRSAVTLPSNGHFTHPTRSYPQSTGYSPSFDYTHPAIDHSYPTSYHHPTTNSHSATQHRLCSTITPTQSASVPSFLSVLPPSTSSYLLQSDASHTLQRSTLSLLSGTSVTIIVLPSRLVVDVNSRCLDMTGRRREDVLYQPVANESAKPIPQYPASYVAINDVMEGRKQQGSVMWRCRWADGLLYESMATFYAMYEQPLASRETRAPDKIMFLSSPEEAVRVDERSLPH